MTEMTTATPVILPTLIDAQRKTNEQFTRLCEEGLRFASLRSEENSRVLRELSACRGLPETFSAWTGYVTRTTQQYSDELKLVTAICSEPARELMGDEPAVLKEAEGALAQAKETAEEGVDPVAKAATEPGTDAAKRPRAN